MCQASLIVTINPLLGPCGTVYALRFYDCGEGAITNLAQWFDLDLVAVASVAPVTSSGPSFEVSSSGSSFEVSNIIAGWGAQMGSREAGVTRARGCGGAGSAVLMGRGGVIVAILGFNVLCVSIFRRLVGR